MALNHYTPGHASPLSLRRRLLRTDAEGGARPSRPPPLTYSGMPIIDYDDSDSANRNGISLSPAAADHFLMLGLCHGNSIPREDTSLILATPAGKRVYETSRRLPRIGRALHFLMPSANAPVGGTIGTSENGIFERVAHAIEECPIGGNAYRSGQNIRSVSNKSCEKRSIWVRVAHNFIARNFDRDNIEPSCHLTCYLSSPGKKFCYSKLEIN